MAESNGLLDFLNNPGAMGLLSAVGAGLAGARRGNAWNAVGSGLLGGVQGYAQAQELQRQNEYANQRGKLFDMQAQQLADAQAKAKAEAEREAARNNYLSGVGQVTSPRLDAQPNQADPRQMLGLGFDPKFIETYMSAGNLGKAKIKDFKEIRNPDGSVSVVGFDEFGNVTNTNQTPFKAPDVRDFGGYVGGVDPITGKVTNYGQKTMSASERDASARGWAGVNLQREQANRDAQAVTYQQDAEGNFVALPTKIQPGSVVRGLPVVSGPGMAPLKGAQKDSKLTESEGKATLYLGQMRAASDTLNKLSSEGKTAEPWQVAMTGNVGGNLLTTSNAQQVAQAQNQWSEAYLRQKTGAAATKDEIKLNNSTFFPQIGDSPAVIKQKAEMRAAAEQGMEIPAGRGAARVGQPSAPKQGGVKFLGFE